MAELCQKRKETKKETVTDRERKEEDGKKKPKTNKQQQPKNKTKNKNPTGCKNSQKIGQCQGFDGDLHCRNSQITEELLPPHGELKDLI